jgi:hypothetical protein
MASAENAVSDSNKTLNIREIHQRLDESPESHQDTKDIGSRWCSLATGWSNTPYSPCGSFNNAGTKFGGLGGLPLAKRRHANRLSYSCHALC